MNTRCSVFLFIILTASAVQASGGSQCLVSGIAEDEDHNAVSGAQVFTHVPPTGWEDLIVTSNADEQGRFSIEYPCDSSEAKLYVAPNLDREKYFVPLNPLISFADPGVPMLSGIRLKKIHDGTYDVGRVIVPTFVRVRLRLEDANGESILPRTFDSGFWLRWRSANGSIVNYSSISRRDWENATKGDKSELEMLLPVGKWFVDVSLNENHGPILHDIQPFEVLASDVVRATPIVVKLRKK